MSRIFLTCLLATALFSAAPAAAQPPLSGPDKAKYQDVPFLAAGATVPEVLVVLSKDHKMFQQAYTDLIKTETFKDKKQVYTGFNPRVKYYGYFDSRSCYAYTDTVTTPTNITAGDTSGYFTRVGSTMEDDSQETLESIALAVKSTGDVKNTDIAKNAARSETGICQRNRVGGNFSGNWLNYITATRMDVIRKVLYGGFRNVDTTARTILTGSFVPNDAHVWGSEVMADDRWATDSPLNPYYDISKYTPFPKPSDGRAHFFARGRSDNTSNLPVMFYLDNANASDIKSSPASGSATGQGRYFDWVMDNKPNPSTSARLNSTGTNNAAGRLKAWAVRVEVCKPGVLGVTSSPLGDTYSETEGCKEYRDKDNKLVSVKPEGLLQKYGDQMLFGLLTGSYKTGSYSGAAATGTWSSNHRHQGGVLRHHIDSIYDYPDENGQTRTRSVDPATGIINTPGSGNGRKNSDSLIWTLDTFRITGRYDMASGTSSSLCPNPGSGIAGQQPDNDCGNYKDADSWGNPIGEMLYEGVRYFARRANGGEGIAPTSDFLPGTESAYNAPSNSSAAFFPAGHAGYNGAWSSLPSDPSACARPVILLISEADSEFDGDQGVNSPRDLTNQKQQVLAGLSAQAFPDFSMPGYLRLITDNENFNDGKYIYSKGRTDDCQPKELGSLMDVKGICPHSPAFEGTYSAAAVAYYAHTHNFSPAPDGNRPVDIYAVALTSTFPEITFPIPGRDGKVEKQISIQPASMSARSTSTTKERILSYINYYLVDWKVDANGTPYYVKFRVNFEDASQGWNPDPDINSGYAARGSDWDMDVIVEYEIELVGGAGQSGLGGSCSNFNDNSYLSSGTSNTIARRSSGQLKVDEGSRYCRIVPERGAAINSGQVHGLLVTTSRVASEAGIHMVMGYTISGTTRDGTYMDRGQMPGYNFKYATPPTCNWPIGYGGATANNPSTGHNCLNSSFSATQGSVNYARNCYQGPDYIAGSGACVATTTPLTLVSHTRTFRFADNSDDAGKRLPSPLWLAAKYGGFTEHREGNPIGVDSGDWERGIPPKNYFQVDNIAELPEKLDQAFKAISQGVSTGTATSASVSSILGGGLSIQTLYYPEYPDPNEQIKVKWLGSVYGLFVDRWGNLREDSSGDGKLTPRTGHPDDSDFPLGDLVVRFEPNPLGGPPIIKRCYDQYGNGRVECPDDMIVSTVQELNPVWDTSKLLALGGPNDRDIFFSRAENGSIAPFKDDDGDSLNYLTEMMVHPETPCKLSPQPADTAGATCNADPGRRTAVAKQLINYIRGQDMDGWRSRTISNPWGSGPVTWKMGDVINSKPIIVGGAASNYDLLYRDQSYQKYKTEGVAQRRHVTYFGTNDGMLHAVNLGFFGSLSDGQVGYRVDDPQGVRKTWNDRALGQEMWAYVPTSVLPHLRWLADPGYIHSYYVDMKPLIADVQIKPESGTPGIEGYDSGWRTILIGGLRLGGREIETGGDPSRSYSEVFALDITNPDEQKGPKFLWRYSAESLGLSVGLPTVVKDQNGEWHVILASGPRVSLDEEAQTANPPYHGYSNKQAQLIVLKAGSGEFEASIPVPETEGSFFNDSFLIMPKIGASWHHELVYYGLTISRNAQECDTGAVYRLRLDGDAPENWALHRLINTERPVTGAVNATLDTQGRQWVLFGTGRLWGPQDMSPCRSAADDSLCNKNHTQYIYGVREPVGDDGLTLADLTPGQDGTEGTPTAEKLAEAGVIIDVSGARVYKSGQVEGLAGVPGLKDVVSFNDNDEIHYNVLASAIRAEGVVGYRRALDTHNLLPNQHTYEMVLTQPKVDGLANGASYMAFTSFVPPKGTCGDDGQSYLHLVDTFTGLPAPYMYSIFADIVTSGGPDPDSGLVPGFISAGKGKATEAVIVKTDGGTKIMASGQDGSIYGLDMENNEAMPRGVVSWREVLDMGFPIGKFMTSGLNELPGLADPPKDPDGQGEGSGE